MDEQLAEKGQRFQLALAGWGKAIWRGLLQGLTPAHCLVCAASVQEAASVCVVCWQKLRILEAPVCDVMGTPFAYDQGDGSVSAEAIAMAPQWRKARAAVLFDDTSKEIVHRLKYGDRTEAGMFMARLMARAGRHLIAETDVIIPVLLHWTRLWKRRFNQAAFLAQHVARASGKTYALMVLKRTRATPPQVGLDAEARRKSMRNAFAVSAHSKIKGRSVLVVDDVRTTGATISACVAKLQAAGATHVDVLTFALVQAPFRPHIES